MGYEHVKQVLEDGGYATTSPNAFRCPAHDDQRASLSLASGDGEKALLYCHAGCETADVLAALDLSWDDLATGRSEGSAIAATYVYLDESNEPLYRVLRLSPKGFFQERWEDGEWKPGMRDVRRVLYHLPEMVRLDGEQTVYVVEGEKDADNLIERAGVFATTLLGGANKWRDEYLEYFTDRKVVIIGDNDDAGRTHVDNLASRLRSVATSVEVRYPAIGKDITDHLLGGLGIEDLRNDADGLQVFEPWDPDEYEAPDDEWLWKPYVPRGGRILVYGASGSLKSLWAAWIGAHLAAEGCKVGYFSLEMNKTQYAKRWRQLKHIGFPKENYRTFGSFMFGQSLETAIRNFEGWDLLIIDSWSQAQGAMGANDNDAISMMDAQFFQPLIQATGASVMILDNTGKDGRDNEGRKVKNDEARGASRKKDIQEVAWWLHRPDEANNFRTRIECRKMRLDVPMPAPVTVETPHDRIEFYYTEQNLMSSTPLWDGMQVTPEEESEMTGGTDPAPSAEASPATPLSEDEEREAYENMLLVLGTPQQKREVRIARGKRRLEAASEQAS